MKARRVPTLAELEARFATEGDCRNFLVARRWPNGVRCPRCDNPKVTKLKRPWSWLCRACDNRGYRFSPLVGTIFEHTRYPLRAWFKVIYLMATAKKGISALHIHRLIGSGSYKTAWYMCHRVRAAMKKGGMFSGPLTGEVEVDETFIGGKAMNRHGRGVGGGKKKGEGGTGHMGKVAVIGAIARKGNVVCKVIEKVDARALEGFVREAVADDVSLVATDEYAGYKHLKDRGGFPHESVSHAKGEYVRGNVHTANLDSFWSLLKRGIVGTFHKVSKDHLPLYLNEFSFRHNNRHNPDIFDAIIDGA